jgi:hypothetical protein
MDAALEAAYRDVSPVAASLVRLDLPGGALCLTDGGFVVFDAGEGDGAETYTQRHPVYGTLGDLPSIKDGAEEQTTRVEVEVLPLSDIAVAALASPTLQGVRVQWWEAVVNRSSGALIGQPLLKFDGELDKPRFRVGEGWALTLECGTQAERMLEPNADWRLNHAFHTRIWGPGELGLINVDGVARKVEWRKRPENPGLFKRLLKIFSPLLAG